MGFQPQAPMQNRQVLMMGLSICIRRMQRLRFIALIAVMHDELLQLHDDHVTEGADTQWGVRHMLSHGSTTGSCNWKACKPSISIRL